MSPDTEIQALPTDMRPTPPPVHSAPFPLSPNSPIIVTSDNNCELYTQYSRPILTPAAPSKRTAQSVAEQASQSFEDESDQSYAYLPQDLREIIKQRRLRERAWHVLLSICTSVICNIESTYLVFKDDIEKEEADIIRNYLQQAIARLVASDNAPKFPLIPHHTKLPVTKGSTQEKVIPKKKASTIPLTPLTNHKGPQPRKREKELQSDNNNNKIQQNSWATVTRNGHKKSRIMQSTPIHTAKITILQSRFPARPSNNIKNLNKRKKNKTKKSDSRLFVRLSQEDEWRKLSPAGIREMIVKRLHVSPAFIGLIKPIRSGFALSPCSSEAREELLKASGGLFLSGAKLEPANQ
ncbi:putative eka-like protein [Erysiphe necator]|uniref:Putative eka-like protein n=1 Tax=Uncinula necator TaxID=52586 RepID=A0A0B1PCY9_UNCNE|nr:putative eka-like protein [Erysiphe necator]